MHITLIYNSTDFAVFDKPAGLPSAPLNKTDIKDTALSQMCSVYPEIATVVGRKPIEGGLIHRIDTATRGLLLAAKTQKTFDYFQKEQTDGRFIKYYTAICCNAQKSLKNQQFISRKPPFLITSKFRSFGPHHQMVSPVTDISGRAAQKKAGEKLYTTEVLEITNITDQIVATSKLSYVTVNISELKTPIVCIKCRINQGYRHQVRAHLALAGFPVIGDALYGIDNNSKQQMLFFATALEFYPPESSNTSSNSKKTLKIMLLEQ